MYSVTKINKMIGKIKELEAENVLLVKKNTELAKKVSLNTGEILTIKDDIKEISMTEPIKK